MWTDVTAGVNCEYHDLTVKQWVMKHAETHSGSSFFSSHAFNLSTSLICILPSALSKYNVYSCTSSLHRREKIDSWKSLVPTPHTVFQGGQDSGKGSECSSTTFPQNKVFHKWKTSVRLPLHKRSISIPGLHVQVVVCTVKYWTTPYCARVYYPRTKELLRNIKYVGVGTSIDSRLSMVQDDSYSN